MNKKSHAKTSRTRLSLELRRGRSALLSAVLLAFMCSSSPIFAGEGKLVATAGLSQVEGAGGGGLAPWATLAGYDSRDEISLVVSSSQANVDDFRLNVWGIAASFYDRVELSFAQQTFDLTTSPTGGDIRQNIFGIKARLYGDVIYSDWPQLAVGLQHKTLLDESVAQAVGAKKSDRGTDLYLAATKVHLGLVYGYNFVWNLALRATKANEMGLLGFGGVENNSYEFMAEASAGLLLSEHLAIGLEYRQKPDNLGLKEDDWKDAFISYIPNKHMSLTLAWAELGTIAGAKDQNGWYLGLNASL